MERVATVLAEARAAGLDLRTDGDRLIVRGPRPQEALARRLLAQKPDVLALLTAEEAEIVWRAVAMGPQIPHRGPVPFLVARDGPVAAGRCLSCGDSLGPTDRVRCRLCAEAARRVLHGAREGGGR